MWIDVYDWTNEYTGGQPKVQLSDIDRMADLGIQTLFVQTAHNGSAADVIEQDRLLPIIARAHDRGMDVVAWYLPTFEDGNVDLRRLVAAAALPVDGLGVDIESLAVPDPADRTTRLLHLSTALRRSWARGPSRRSRRRRCTSRSSTPTTGRASRGRRSAPSTTSSCRCRTGRGACPSGSRAGCYTGTDIDRIRASTGRPGMPIHVVGGVADGITLDDVVGMVHAIQARRILGGSLYDWNTSQAAQWALLRALRFG